jgi:uncharacterized membrane protein
MTKPLGRVGRTLLTGLLAILPLYLTVRALSALFYFVDEGASRWVARVLRREPYVGTGVLVTVLVVFLVGLFVQTIGVARFGSAIDAIVKKIPGVGRVYGTIRMLLDPLSNPESRPFRDACWIEVGEGMRVMGFITSPPFHETPDGEARVNVYLPMSHPYVGYVVTVPADRVRPCPAAFDEVVSYHLSCGSARIPTVKN